MAVDVSQVQAPQGAVPVATPSPAGTPGDKKAAVALHLSGAGSQYLILLAVIAGWGFSLVEYYVNHVALAQPIADGGWAALLIAFRADFTSGG